MIEDQSPAPDSTKTEKPRSRGGRAGTKAKRPACEPAAPGPFLPTAVERAAQERTLEKPERVSSAGLIHMPNEDRVGAVPLFYHAERSKWYAPNGQGGFGNLSDSQAKSLVAEYGFHKSLKDDQGNTQADRAMLWLIQRRSVAYAGPLAGYPAGCHELKSGRILVTESPRIITPQPGAFPTIQLLVETLLTDERHDQVTCFLLWLSESLAAFRQRLAEPDAAHFRHCPALAIFGPKSCGKTALVELVLQPLFGGRKADPTNYLKEPKFNKDLIGASLLVLDDKNMSANLAERRARGEGIKDLIWKPEQRMEGKGLDALMLRPFWRFVIVGNDDDGGLQMAPALSRSLEDKLLILRARQAEGLPTTHEANAEWSAKIAEELPAFASFLLSWRPPAGLKLDPRSRVLNFWHPELVSLLRDLQPEMRLLELIDSLDLIGTTDGEVPNPLWEGSASDFERDMRRLDKERVLDRTFVSGTSAGRMLSELARMTPERVRKTDRDGRSHYRIFRQPQ